jgi:fatty acid desaturase
MDQNWDAAVHIKRQPLSFFAQIANIFHLLVMHTILLVWLVMSPQYIDVVTFLLVSIVVVLFHQRMMSEWLHEASHWNLLDNKTLNDVVANILILPFLGMPIQVYRKQHFRHHGLTAYFQDGDPDTIYHLVRTTRELAAHVLGSLTGVNSLKLYFSFLGSGSNEERDTASDSGNVRGWFIAVGVFHLLAFYYTILLSTVYIYPLYYGVLLTIYPLFQTLRAWGQHACIESDGTAWLVGSKISRSMYGGFVEFLFFNSDVMSFHFEHHAWPALPFRQLKSCAVRSEDPNINGKGCIGIGVAVWKGLRAK